MIVVWEKCYVEKGNSQMSQLRMLVGSYKLISLFTGMLILLGMGDVGAPPTAWSQQLVEYAAPNPVGATFTYQGRLSTNDGPVTGVYDFQFTLYDAESGGNVIGAVQTHPNVSVDAGSFIVQLDFGAGAFSGAPRWLAIGVRPTGSGDFEALAPRQPLTPVPYAIYADHAGTVAWANITSKPPGFADDVDNEGVSSGGDITAVKAGDGLSGGGETGDVTLSVNFGTVASLTHDHLGQTWAANGNSLTIEGAVNGLYNAPLILNNTGNGSGLVVKSQGSNTANGLNVENHSGYAAIFAENKGVGNGVGVVVQNANALNVESTTGTYATVYGENRGAGPSVVGISQGGVGGDFETYSGNNIIEGYEIISNSPYNANLRFKVTRAGNVNADGTIAGGGADFAELLPADPGLAPGDVLVIGAHGRLIRSSIPNAANVAGVYSTKPGFVGGWHMENGEATAVMRKSMDNRHLTADGAGDTVSADVPLAQAQASDRSSDGVTAKTALPDPFTLAYTQQGKVPLAVIGVVPVKITAENGPIQPGDLLTTSSLPGHAMKANPVNLAGIELYRPGTIIGKALEPWTNGAGVIQVLIVLQ